MYIATPVVCRTPGKDLVYPSINYFLMILPGLIFRDGVPHMDWALGQWAWIVILSVYGAGTIAEVKIFISPFLR
jgi:hypothetical protein